MQSFVFGEHEYSKQNSTQFIHRSCSILGLCPDEPILSWKYPKPKMHPTHRSPQLGLAYLRRAQNRSLQLSKILWDKGDFYDKAVTFSFVEHHTQSDKENDRECISCLPWWPGADRELTGSWPGAAVHCPALWEGITLQITSPEKGENSKSGTVHGTQKPCGKRQ